MNQTFRRGPLAVLLTGVFLIVLDFFIVNVALPSMQRDLDADPTTLEWLVAGYGLTFGGLLLPASRLADRYGRRRVFLLGTALFVISSAACGLAPDADTLLAARLLQGAGAAAVGPTVLALIGDVYAGPARLRALAAYATVMGVAAASGQLVGGLLIHLDVAGSGWRSIFLINVPIGLAALVAGPRLLPEVRLTTPRPDPLETVLVVGALTALVLPLVEGERLGWPLWTWLTLAAAVAAGALAVLRGRRLTHPLVDLAALSSRPVAAGLLGLGALFSGMAAYFLVLALYLQDTRGLGALASGAVFTAVALPYMAGSRQAGAVLGRLGPRLGVAAGALTFGAGHLLLLLAADGPLAALVPGLAVGGAGMGVALSGLVGVTLGSVAPAQAGTVSATSSTVQQVANALGVALVGIVFFARTGPAAFEAGLVYLVVTTLAVAAAAAFLPGRPRTAPAQRAALATSSSAAA
ncbi:MFS transporter [Nocardioides anomalus]|uniref:MFS transporter n=1 Tax=Nocardioides anomalus TaxID=2712223 RepID=A0A6G6WF04_9ACTN|nr:MFS transporter [Nocardioides anomalus]QIG43786.1 MFS transporter [Nocardioides anomalus]